MYHSHPLDSAYANPGFYVDGPSGTVRDSSGRSVSLTPDLNQRSARRIFIRSSDVDSNDGVYTAQIRRAKNVSAIKLCYASIPKEISRVTAQLILYSINIKQNLSLTDDVRKRSLQRLCRNQLLSNDTSDYPFFRVSKDDFDWRNSTGRTTWINSFDRNTEIPPQLESETSNQYVDIDILTVKVPSMCSLAALGHAFSNSLKSHSGAKNRKNNSLWSHFDISVEDAGFSVLENINESESFKTFASIYSPDMLGHNDSVSTQSARNFLRPMRTPLQIRLTKSRSIFISKAALDGAATAPASITGSNSEMEEYTPDILDSNSDHFIVNVDDPSRIIYSFSALSDLSENDVLEVKSGKVIELFVSQVPTSTTPTFTVQYRYGKFEDINNNVQQVRVISANTQEFKIITDYELRESEIVIQGTWNSSLDMLTLGDGTEIIVREDTVFFVDLNADEVVNVSEVKRTYQKYNDIKLGMRWGDKEENEDFFIDQNHSFESNILDKSFQPENIDQNYPANSHHRTDVAVLSQYSNVISVTLSASVAGGDLELSLNNHDGIISEGMVLTVLQQTASVTKVINQNKIEISESIGTVTVGTTLTIRPQKNSNNGFFNMLRNHGDLADTYMQPRDGTNEIFNTHEFNDSHQMKRMLFSGHMMNVEEPIIMPLSDDANSPTADSALRPPTLESVDGANKAIKEFYNNGLGWQTSIVHKKSKFIMPAFPVRFTQINEDEDSSDPHSIYNVSDVKSVETSISPLVSKLLSITNVDNKNLGYYKLHRLKNDGTVDDTFQEETGGATGLGSDGVGNVSYYEPRNDDNGGGIIVSLGDQNYVIKSARLVSVLRNKTDFTLDLSCDRNHNSKSSPLSSITTLQKIRDELRNSPSTPGRSAQLERVESELQNAHHTFYKDLAGGYVVNANAKYFSWVFELDREIELPTGITNSRNAFQSGHPNPPITNRSFNGLIDKSAMFSPGVFERFSGRPALSVTQQNVHNFFVRSGAAEEDNVLVQLHNVGSLERPINSKSKDRGDFFAIMTAENDQKKPDKLACETTTFFSSPTSLDKIDFSFISSKSGKKIDIGNQNATLIMEIYASNE